jgi:soluble P-type ATPase
LFSILSLSCLDLKGLKESGLNIYILSGHTREENGKNFPDHPGIEVTLTTTAENKRSFVEKMGGRQTVCIGNGNIDAEMFKVARLSICTVQKEGAATPYPA